MENDTIRVSGGNTLVDVWIEGKMRAVCVSAGAIEAGLGIPSGSVESMPERERSEFVRTHMAAILKAARKKLGTVGAAAETITIDAAELAPHAAEKGSDRRKTERRKGERRKADRPELIPFGLERRRGERRKSPRRTPRSEG